MRTVGSDAPLVRALVHVAVTVAVLWVTWLVTAFVAYVIAGPTGSVDALVVARTLLGLVALLVVVRWRGASALRAGLPVVPWTGYPGALAYLLVPASWVGETLLGRGVVDLPLLAGALDLVVWGAAVGLGVLWAGATEELRERPLTPYGG